MDTPGLDFASLGLRGDLLSTLNALGYEEPTPIQAAAIPLLIGGNSVRCGGLAQRQVWHARGRQGG